MENQTLNESHGVAQGCLDRRVPRHEARTHSDHFREFGSPAAQHRATKCGHLLKIAREVPQENVDPAGTTSILSKCSRYGTRADVWKRSRWELDAETRPRQIHTETFCTERFVSVVNTCLTPDLVPQASNLRSTFGLALGPRARQRWATDRAAKSTDVGSSTWSPKAKWGGHVQVGWREDCKKYSLLQESLRGKPTRFECRNSDSSSQCTALPSGLIFGGRAATTCRDERR